LIRADLCDQAIALARQLRLVLPAEPEVTGLLALLLLTDARRAAGPDPTARWSCWATGPHALG
jgi:RNA polymerase sigma-70 factor (ECF subfamily)